MGLFALVEQVDKDFVLSRFDDQAQSDLYKEVWPRDPGSKSFGKRRKFPRVGRDHESIRQFARDLLAASASSDEELVTVASTWVDLDLMLSIFVVNQAINNWDGPTGLSGNVGGRGYGNHNFYLYRSLSDGKFWLIPWDMGTTFRTHTSRDGVPVWNDLDVNLSASYPLPGGDVAYPAVVDPLIRAVALYGENRFVATASKIMSRAFSEEKTQAKLARWKQQIRPFVEVDRHLQGRWGSFQRVWKWEAGVESLSFEARRLRDGMNALVDPVADSEPSAKAPASAGAVRKH